MTGIDHPIKFLTYLLLAFFIGCLVDMILKIIIKQEDIFKTAPISVLLVAVFLYQHGYSLQALQNIFLCQILLFASIIDLKTHTIPDYIHFLILMTGLIGLQPGPALCGLLIVPLPFFIAALVKEDSIGGGDIKLMGACGFVLGVKTGYTAFLIGLFLAIMFQKLYFKGEKRFALAPYLSLGIALSIL